MDGDDGLGDVQGLGWGGAGAGAEVLLVTAVRAVRAGGGAVQVLGGGGACLDGLGVEGPGAAQGGATDADGGKGGLRLVPSLVASPQVLPVSVFAVVVAGLLVAPDQGLGVTLPQVLDESQLLGRGGGVGVGDALEGLERGIAKEVQGALNKGSMGNTRKSISGRFCSWKAIKRLVVVKGWKGRGKKCVLMYSCVL